MTRICKTALRAIGTMIVAFCGALASPYASATDAPARFRISEQHALAGEGSWDYLALDATGRRLFVTRSDRVQVIHPDTGELLAEIPGTAGVHGVAFAEDLHLGFTSNGRSNSVTVFDTQTLQTVTQIKVRGSKPDAILYVPQSRRVFVFDGDSNSVDVIDAVQQKLVHSFELGGRPEFAVNDGTHVFVNLEDSAKLASIDIATEKVTRQVALTPCEEPTGLAIDPRLGHLYSVCANGKMMVVDVASGKIVGEIGIGKRPDAVAVDPATGRIYASCGEGTLAVVGRDDHGHYGLLASVPTRPGAKTLALDSARQRVYLVAAQYEVAAAPSAEQPHPRPKAIAGSFQLLVVTPVQ